MASCEDLEALAKFLERSGEFRVLRKLQPRTVFEQSDGTQTKLGIFLDLETTGLDHRKDEIIEIAMLPFTYTVGGRIIEIHEPFHRLRQPSISIPVQITKLTGITDDMVAGHFISQDDVRGFVKEASLIVAHNAGFDRKFAEEFSPVFAEKPWACSMTEINWVERGIEGRKLGHLASSFGFFFDGHRALDDCRALMEVLLCQLPNSSVTGFSILLEAARKPSYRIWAEGAPFEFKDVLKGRGYRWNPDAAKGRPKAWYFDCIEEAVDAERKFLCATVFQEERPLLIDRFTAFERHSDRM